MFTIEGNIPAVGGRSRSRPAGPPASPIESLMAFQARARQRRALAALDDRLLADIGLSRSAIAAELAKPFWKR